LLRTAARLRTASAGGKENGENKISNLAKNGGSEKQKTDTSARVCRIAYTHCCALPCSRATYRFLLRIALARITPSAALPADVGGRHGGLGVTDESA